MHTDGVGDGGKMEPNKEEDEADEGSLGPKSWSNFTVDEDEEDHACFLLLSMFKDMYFFFFSEEDV
jgi:hypothetical protein